MLTLLQVQPHWMHHHRYDGNGLPYNFPFIPVATQVTPVTTNTAAPPIDPRINAMLNTNFGFGPRFNPPPFANN